MITLWTPATQRRVVRFAPDAAHNVFVDPCALRQDNGVVELFHGPLGVLEEVPLDRWVLQTRQVQLVHLHSLMRMVVLHLGLLLWIGLEDILFLSHLLQLEYSGNPTTQ